MSATLVLGGLLIVSLFFLVVFARKGVRAEGRADYFETAFKRERDENIEVKKIRENVQEMEIDDVLRRHQRNDNPDGVQ